MASSPAQVCPVPGAGAISGEVTAAADGEPVAGVSLLLERMIDGFVTLVAGTETGANGAYQFAAVPAGDYKVRTRDTPLLVDEIWPGDDCDQFCDPQSGGTVVTVAPGASVEAIDFALAEGGRVEGVVYQADGTTPAAGAEVELYAMGPFGTGQLAPVAADASGAWSVDGLETRSYKARAFAPGLVAEVYPNAPCALACDVLPIGNAIAVVAGETTSGIDVALAAGGGVSGVVTDLAAVPLAGVFVQVSESAGFGSAYSLTGADGGWSTVPGLPAGNYRARTLSAHADEAWNDIPCEPFCSQSTGTLIAVGAGVTSGIDFALARLGAVSGTIVEAGSGNPLGGVQVVARGDGPFPFFATTASDGTYRIGGLAPGSYLVAAGDGVHVGEIYDGAGTCYDLLTCVPTETATLVDVVGTGESGGVDFELEAGGTISGSVVVAATNVPVQSAMVSLHPSDGSFGFVTYTDGLGRFAIAGIPPGGGYRLVAQPSSGSLLGEVWEEQPCTPGSCPSEAGDPVAVAAGASTCVAFTLDGVADSAGIAGTVTGEDGPLAGVQLAIYDAGGALRGTVFSDSEGNYLTSGAVALDPGNHFVIASGAFGYSNELYDDLPCAACDPTTGTPVAVVDGATTSGIDFQLEPVGSGGPLPLVFLEDCKPGGCTYFRGMFEDSRINRSTILGPASANLPPFSGSAGLWGDLVACVQRAFRPFAIEVTDVDPGTVPHLEHVVAGLPQHIGQQSGVGGVSPFSCGFISNSISYTFAEAYLALPPASALRDLCWTAVHEIAHQHGLDHHAYVPDALTYASGCGAKRLIARDMPCGEIEPAACFCGGASENSYEWIRTIHGPSDLLFEDGFEVVEPGENCAWSEQLPPAAPFAPLDPVELALRPRCGALEASNPGFRPDPRGPR